MNRKQSEKKRDADYDAAVARRDERRERVEDELFEAMNVYRNELRKVENAYFTDLDAADRRHDRRTRS